MVSNEWTMNRSRSVGQMDLPKRFQSFIVAFEFHDHCQCIDQSVVVDEFGDSGSNTASRVGKNVAVDFHLLILRSSRLIIGALKSRNDYVTSVRIATPWPVLSHAISTFCLFALIEQ